MILTTVVLQWQIFIESRRAKIVAVIDFRTLISLQKETIRYVIVAAQARRFALRNNENARRKGTHCYSVFRLFSEAPLLTFSFSIFRNSTWTIVLERFMPKRK